jgi:hypothetical protein
MPTPDTSTGKRTSLTDYVIFDVFDLDASNRVKGQGLSLEMTETGTVSFGSSQDCDIVLEGAQVSRHHFDLNVSANRVMLMDQNSTNGADVNGIKTCLVELSRDDAIEIPGWRLVVTALLPARAQTSAPQTAAEPHPDPSDREFPANVFGDEAVLDADGLTGRGYPVETVKFCAVGGGLGSYTFVDHAPCFGVPASDIVVISTDKISHATHKRYCRDSQIPDPRSQIPDPRSQIPDPRSQIPDHERLQSNSLSTPDNIWGVPAMPAVRLWAGFCAAVWAASNACFRSLPNRPWPKAIRRVRAMCLTALIEKNAASTDPLCTGRGKRAVSEKPAMGAMRWPVPCAIQYHARSKCG